MPEMGSVFDAGHSPLGAFFRAAHVEPSPAGADPTPFACCGDDDDVEMVELLDACEERDEDELERWALLRGMNILKSSVLMGGAPLGTPLAPVHPCREMFWKFGGGATAVIDSSVRRRAASTLFWGVAGSAVTFPRTHPVFLALSAATAFTTPIYRRRQQQPRAAHSCTHAARGGATGEQAQRGGGSGANRAVVVCRVLVVSVRATSRQRRQ